MTRLLLLLLVVPQKNRRPAIVDDALCAIDEVDGKSSGRTGLKADWLDEPSFGITEGVMEYVGPLL
jgi:hypothetical protein